MKLPKTCKDTNRGLSLIEILVLMGILAFILSFGVFLNFDFFESHNFLSEEKILTGLLRMSRNRALNDIDQMPHGLFVGPEDFILFQGESFVEDSSANEYFPRNKNVLIENTFASSTVVWENVSALPSESGEFRIFDDNRETVIVINSFGGIND